MLLLAIGGAVVVDVDVGVMPSTVLLMVYDDDGEVHVVVELFCDCVTSHAFP